MQFVVHFIVELCICSNDDLNFTSQMQSTESTGTFGGIHRKKKRQRKITSQKPFKLRTEVCAISGIYAHHKILLIEWPY